MVDWLITLETIQEFQNSSMSLILAISQNKIKDINNKFFLLQNWLKSMKRQSFEI